MRDLRGYKYHQVSSKEPRNTNGNTWLENCVFFFNSVTLTSSVQRSEILLNSSFRVVLGRAVHWPTTHYITRLRVLLAMWSTLVLIKKEIRTEGHFMGQKVMHNFVVPYFVKSFRMIRIWPALWLVSYWKLLNLNALSRVYITVGQCDSVQKTILWIISSV